MCRDPDSTFVGSMCPRNRLRIVTRGLYSTLNFSSNIDQRSLAACRSLDGTDPNGRTSDGFERESAKDGIIGPGRTRTNKFRITVKSHVPGLRFFFGEPQRTLFSENLLPVPNANCRAAASSLVLIADGTLP